MILRRFSNDESVSTRLPIQSHDIDYMALAHRFNEAEVDAIALLGSHAREDAGLHSDVDLLRIVTPNATATGAGSHLIDNRLVVVSDATPDDIDRWFSEPQEAVNVIQGLRDARPLLDPVGCFAALRTQAKHFTWTTELQEKADRFAGKQMVGWIEEAHKGLEGLRRDDTGRLLNARFGLSWGLMHVMQVQRGVLRGSDNDFGALAAAMGDDSVWTRLLAQSFAMDGQNLRSAVTAGLHLYCETAVLLHGHLPVDADRLVAATVRRIQQELGTETVLPDDKTKK